MLSTILLVFRDTMVMCRHCIAPICCSVIFTPHACARGKVIGLSVVVVRRKSGYFEMYSPSELWMAQNCQNRRKLTYLCSYLLHKGDKIMIFIRHTYSIMTAHAQALYRLGSSSHKLQSTELWSMFMGTKIAKSPKKIGVGQSVLCLKSHKKSILCLLQITWTVSTNRAFTGHAYRPHLSMPCAGAISTVHARSQICKGRRVTIDNTVNCSLPRAPG